MIGDRVALRSKYEVNEDIVPVYGVHFASFFLSKFFLPGPTATDLAVCMEVNLALADYAAGLDADYLRVWSPHFAVVGAVPLVRALVVERDVPALLETWSLVDV